MRTCRFSCFCFLRNQWFVQLCSFFSFIHFSEVQKFFSFVIVFFYFIVFFCMGSDADGNPPLARMELLSRGSSDIFFLPRLFSPYLFLESLSLPNPVAKFDLSLIGWARYFSLFSSSGCCLSPFAPSRSPRPLPIVTFFIFLLCSLLPPSLKSFLCSRDFPFLLTPLDAWIFSSHPAPPHMLQSYNTSLSELFFLPRLH